MLSLYSKPFTDPIPRDKSFDSTLALLSEGYHFISNRCKKYKTDVFRTRITFKKVICMQGAEAAKIFYDKSRFTRKNAAPISTTKLLQDFRSVQMLNDGAHRVRKSMFMNILNSHSSRQLVEIFEHELKQRIKFWEAQKRITFFYEIEKVLCKAVCSWSGVHLSESDLKKRTKEFSEMVNAAGSAGPKNWLAQILRSRCEKWARGIIDDIRSGQLLVSRDSPAYIIATHKDHQGKLLDTVTAAVELINILRPTVAVGRFITFAFLALHENPHLNQKLFDDQYLEYFVQEVRRFYPFFPFVGGKVIEEFTWRSHKFKKGDWVLFDLYGTNHDPKTWKDPHMFDPERFRNWNGSPYNFVAQGAGDHHKGHRCPGEQMTIELMKSSVRTMAAETEYEVPEQDLEINFTRMPAIPKSGLMMERVRSTI